MPWKKPGKGGWSATDEDAPATRFSQIIRTILEVVPGGVIRNGKTGWDDDGHVGFWLGVGADGVARFSIGGPAFWLKWTGSELLVRGRISTATGAEGDEPVQWIGADGGPVARIAASDGWGHWLTVELPRGHEPGDPAMIDLLADGDFGAALRLRLVTERGSGKSGTKVLVLVGNSEVFRIDGAGNVWAQGGVSAGGAVTGTNLGGWSGTVRTDEIATLTVAGGRITAVA